MPEETVLWIDVFERYVDEFEYIAVLDCTSGSQWRELEHIANYEIINGCWVGLEDNVVYTLQSCEPRKVDGYSSVTIFATNRLESLLDLISPAPQVASPPVPALKVTPYFNDDTRNYLAARDKFNSCNTRDWNPEQLKHIAAIVATASKHDVTDFIIAALGETTLSRVLNYIDSRGAGLVTAETLSSRLDVGVNTVNKAMASIGAKQINGKWCYVSPKHLAESDPQ